MAPKSDVWLPSANLQVDPSEAVRPHEEPPTRPGGDGDMEMADVYCAVEPDSGEPEVPGPGMAAEGGVESEPDHGEVEEEEGEEEEEEAEIEDPNSAGKRDGLWREPPPRTGLSSMPLCPTRVILSNLPGYHLLFCHTPRQSFYRAFYHSTLSVHAATSPAPLPPGNMSRLNGQ